MKEHWKPVVGFEALYAVSNRGRVFSFRKKQLMRFWLKSGGQPSDKYWVLELTVNGVSDRFFIHVLVLTAFRGPRPVGQECRHLDGDRLNNHISNLTWGTYEENREDYRKQWKGVKLTPDLVRYIRQSAKTVRALAAELGCGKSTVAYARNGHLWAHIS